MERQVSELSAQLTDLRAQVRLLDMNNAEDLQELFDAVKQIQDRFNQNSAIQDTPDEHPIPPSRKSNLVEATSGKISFTPRLAAAA